MSTIVYGDFTCPFSYLASRRLDLLAEAGAEVEWRAVEHAPRTPLTGMRRDAEQQHAAEQEWHRVQGLLLPGERLPGRPPSLQASTQAAVAGYAEAVGAGVPATVRRLLFHAYWVDGLDIGHPEILRALLCEPIRAGRATSAPLREFGYAVTPARGPVTSAAYRRIREWRKEWASFGDETIPVLEQDGATLSGIPAVIRLGDLVTDPSAPQPEPPLHAGVTVPDRLMPPSSERCWY